jgi:hypothetical protein
MKKCLIHILLVSLTINSYAQLSDTTIFFNELGPTESKNNASRIIMLKQVSNRTFIQHKSIKYSDKDKLYFKDRYLEIRETFNDSIYYFSNIYESCCGKRNYHSEKEYMVVFNRKDRGFNLRVYNSEKKLVQRGESLLIAPIIWNSKVDFFNEAGLLTVKRHFKEGVLKSIEYFDRYGKAIQDPTKSPEQMPIPLESEESFEIFVSKYLATNYNFPKKAKSENQMPTIYVGFIITSNGSVECVHFLNKGHELFEQQIASTIDDMPKFKPATNNEKPVNFLYYLPVKHFLR